MPRPYIAAYDVYSIGVVMAELILGRLNCGTTNVLQAYVTAGDAPIVDGWKKLERHADAQVIWNPNALQLVCQTALQCITLASQGQLSTEDLLSRLIKAVNLQAGICYSEPEGAGNGPPCALCTLPRAVVRCHGESHALCSSCIEEELLKGPHTPGRQLSCLIRNCEPTCHGQRSLSTHKRCGVQPLLHET